MRMRRPLPEQRLQGRQCFRDGERDFPVPLHRPQALSGQNAHAQP
jgi:hypothetical protein